MPDFGFKAKQAYLKLDSAGIVACPILDSRQNNNGLTKNVTEL